MQDVDKFVDLITSDACPSSEELDSQITELLKRLETLRTIRDLINRVHSDLPYMPDRVAAETVAAIRMLEPGMPKHTKPTRGLHDPKVQELIDYLRVHKRGTASEIGAELGLHHTAVGRLAASVPTIVKNGSYYELEE